MKILIFALNDIYFGIPFADISFVEGKNRVNIEKMSDVSGYITGMVDYHNMTFSHIVYHYRWDLWNNS